MEESSDLLADSISINQSEKESEIDVMHFTEDTTSESDKAIENTDEGSGLREASESVTKPVKHLKLPFSKIKHIMKMDPDVNLIQQDAVFLVSKATELFIEYLTRETNKQLAGIKRKTVMRRDVDVTIENIPQLCFLDGALE